MPLSTSSPIRLVGLLAALCIGGAACEREPPNGAAVRQLVIDSLRSWETGHEQAFVATAHDELLFAYPGKRTDAAGALEVFREWRDDYKDTRVYINWILVDGNRFAAEYQFATTRKADDKRSVVGTVAIGEVRDGKIVLLKEYLDGRVSRMQTAGELPLDEGNVPFPWPLAEGQ